MGKYDWDTLKSDIEENALKDSSKKDNTYDDRFYKLARNEKDVGGAIVRFIPDKDNIMFIKMFAINADKGYNRRFCNKWSPTSIGLPDPFNERFLTLWRAGEKDEARRFGRSERYLTNIKIIKDPANPQNEGKIFLFNMSKAIFEKIKFAAEPPESELELDPNLKPKQVYNPLNGNNFILKAGLATTGFVSYEKSDFDSNITSIYDSEEEADKDINENSYSLNEFLQPEFYASYEDLQDCLDWYTNEKEVKTENSHTPNVDNVAAAVSDTAVSDTIDVERIPDYTSVKSQEVDEIDALIDELV